MNKEEQNLFTREMAKRFVHSVSVPLAKRRLIRQGIEVPLGLGHHRTQKKKL